MASASHARHKNHARGYKGRQHASIVNRPTVHYEIRFSHPVGCFLQQCHHPGIHGIRFGESHFTIKTADISPFTYFFHPPLNLFHYGMNGFFIGGSNLHGEGHLLGNYVGPIRQNLNFAHRGHCLSLAQLNSARLYLQDTGCRRHQCILPSFHGRCAGMIAHPNKGELNHLHAINPVHNSNADSSPGQYRPLLNVKLQHPLNAAPVRHHVWVIGGIPFFFKNFTQRNTLLCFQ